MKAHLDALAAKIGGTVPVDLWASEPGRVPPWIVLEAPAWAGDPADCICGIDHRMVTDVRLKAVAGTTEGVAIMLANARAALPGVLTVAGRGPVIVKWSGSEFIDLDTSATIPGTSRHPAYGVDTYRVVSEVEPPT